MSSPVPEPTIAQLAAEMIDRGVRNIHVLAWRDLDDDDAGGSEEHADQLMRRWAAAGLDITHRTSAAGGLASTARRNGYRVIRRGSRYSVFPRVVASELTRRMGRYDALVEIWNGVPWFSPVWCHRPRITFLHHVHGPMWDQLMPRPLAGLGRALEARIAPPFYRRTSMVTPSEATRADLLRLGFRADKVIAVSNGIDERFRPAGTARQIAAARATHPTVISVGRLAPVKRQEAMIEAAVIARRRLPDLRLVIVGEGPLRPVLERCIAELGAQHWISLTGRLDHDQLCVLYQQAWLVASASLVEGWGLTLTEAAACATTCVATDISGHSASVIDGVTGVLAPLDRLGETIADVLLDEQWRDALAKSAQRRAATLTWEASACGVLAALHRQIGSGQIR